MFNSKKEKKWKPVLKSRNQFLIINNKVYKALVLYYNILNYFY